MTQRRSILIYCQHLSGTGHFVRSYEIARAMAEVHDVWLLDGGRPVPRSAASDSLRLMTLPRIVRKNGKLRSLDSKYDITDVMRNRLRQLHDAVRTIRPDVLIVEHFPFSKWELESEIMAMVAACRQERPEGLIVGSLRDIVVPSRFDPEPQAHSTRTLSTLAATFDGVLVHADPHLTRIEEHLPWADRIPVPVAYTGYVSEKPATGISESCETPRGPGPVIVSGGGADDGALAERCLHAWRGLAASGDHGGREMIVFLPPFADAELTSRLARLAADVGAQVRPFGTDFLAGLDHADLSISQAGYNTCVNLLQTRTRAILVPNDRMSDQVIRARLFAGRGLAMHRSLDECAPAILANAIRVALAQAEPRHDLDLDGANGTTRILEQWATAHGPRHKVGDRVPLASPSMIGP